MKTTHPSTSTFKFGDRFLTFPRHTANTVPTKLNFDSLFQIDAIKYLVDGVRYYCQLEKPGKYYIESKRGEEGD